MSNTDVAKRDSNSGVGREDQDKYICKKNLCMFASKFLLKQCFSKCNQEIRRITTLYTFIAPQALRDPVKNYLPDFFH